MGAQRTSGVTKARLPQHRKIEQTFNQNHRGKLANRFPGEQATLGARKELMGEGGSDTAAVEVDDASANSFLAPRVACSPGNRFASFPGEQATLGARKE